MKSEYLIENLVQKKFSVPVEYSNPVEYSTKKKIHKKQAKSQKIHEIIFAKTSVGFEEKMISLFLYKSRSNNFLDFSIFDFDPFL